MSGAEQIAEQVAQAVEGAERKKASNNAAVRGSQLDRYPFRVKSGYVERRIETTGQDDEIRKHWVPFISELNILAVTRSAEGVDWGRLLEVVDLDGTRHEWAMPVSMLAGSGEALRGELLALGMRPVPGASRKWKEWLNDYLFGAQPEARARCVGGIGWHGDAFVLPDETISERDESERVILQSGERLAHAFNVSGTLDEWKEHVAAPALGNSRLVLAISTAFAGPLLKITGDDSGGFHLRGGSSVGKSTALHVAGSVWGGGEPQGYMKTWRATDNALEATAAMHDDALLCLDELSQVDPRAAGTAAYMLGNGRGKARAGKEGQARRGYEWKLMFLSTGEIGLADKIREGGGQIAAGMEVRVIDVRADAGAELGIFEELGDAPDAATFSQALRTAAAKYYGTAAREFLRATVANLEEIRSQVADLRRAFIETAVPLGADGQVRRVADRFALVAAAGDLASAMGVTGWPVGVARDAALRCFEDWLTERGGAGSGEVADAKRRLAEALETYGAARFQKWHINSDRAVITPRWGFLKSISDEGDNLDDFEWYFQSSSLREILRGLDFRGMVKALLEEGVIVPQGNKRAAATTFHVPNAGGKIRLYQVNAALLGGAGDASPEDAGNG